MFSLEAWVLILTAGITIAVAWSKSRFLIPPLPFQIHGLFNEACLVSLVVSSNLKRYRWYVRVYDHYSSKKNEAHNLSTNYINQNEPWNQTNYLVTQGTCWSHENPFLIIVSTKILPPTLTKHVISLLKSTKTKNNLVTQGTFKSHKIHTRSRINDHSSSKTNKTSHSITKINWNKTNNLATQGTCRIHETCNRSYLLWSTTPRLEQTLSENGI